MKLRYIFTMFAALLALVFTGCQEEEGRFLEEVKVSQSYIAIPAAGGSVDITVTSVDTWEITGIPEWLDVSPVTGSAGETKVTFSAGEATATNEATLYLNCAGASQTLKVLQMTEKVELPISTCAEVNGGEDGLVYRIKGTVTSIVNTTYGNMYVQDETGSVYVYGVLYEGAEKLFLKHGIDVGDIVTVEGPRKTYNGTIELVNVTVIDIEKSLIKVDEVAPETGVLPKEGGDFAVTLTCKGEGVSVVVPEAAKSWLSVSGVSTSGTTSVVTFSAPANEGGARSTDIEFVTKNEGVEYKAVTTLKQEGSILEVSIADFLAAEEGSALYKLTGKVANLTNDTYGNFDLVDASGSVYVYGLTATPAESNDKSFSTLGIKEGDVLTLIGTRASHKETAQVGGPAYYVSHEGHTESTIADFLAAEVGDTWYKLTGTISNIVMDKNDPTVQSPYGNFDITDETGTVYVYGLTVAPVAKNDKSFPNLGLEEGDVVTLIGKRAAYNDAPQVGGPAYYISHEEGTTEEPVEPENPEVTATLDGKQWYAESEDQKYVLDFGAQEENSLIVAIPTNDGGFGLYMYGKYTIEAADATSGKVVFTPYDWEWKEDMDPIEIPYSELAEESVKMTAASIFGGAEALAFAVVAEPYKINTDVLNGGEDVKGALEDGDYWIYEPSSKVVMAPIAETATSARPSNGYVSVEGDVVASTVENVFTFTYVADKGLYTIKDSYGRYVYSDYYNENPSAFVYASAELPEGDKAYWNVSLNDGTTTYTIYNAETDYELAYSSSYGNWSLYAYGHTNLLPTLIKAENPVTEPEAPKTEPKGGIDVLTYDFIGLTAASYTDWDAKVGESGAVYAGQTYTGAKGFIQVRSKNNNSGIVTTASGGKVSKIKVTWTATDETKNTNGRVLSVYGSATAYATPADLYSTDTQGTLIGSITFNEGETTAELEVSDDYSFVGLRSADGTIYMDNIEITWVL